MDNLKLCESDYRFMTVIWENEPLTTKTMVALCQEKLNWKRTTSYTVLKKLCNRGIFTVKDGVISSLISKSQFRGIMGQQFLQANFQGSLPAFFAAFTAHNRLSQKEIDQIRQMIDSFEVDPK